MGPLHVGLPASLSSDISPLELRPLGGTGTAAQLLLLGGSGTVRAGRRSSRKAGEFEKGAVSQRVWAACSERQGESSPLKLPEGIRQEFICVVLSGRFVAVLTAALGNEYRGESGQRTIRICRGRPWGLFPSAQAAATKTTQGRQQQTSTPCSLEEGRPRSRRPQGWRPPRTVPLTGSRSSLCAHTLLASLP